MNISLLEKVWRRRFGLLRHESWDRRKIEAFQSQCLTKLRTHAMKCSRFYKSRLRSFENKPLNELPIITKPELMHEFDDAVTDPNLHLRELLDHAKGNQAGNRYLNKYWVTATSGTTGTRGVFPWTNDEWAWILSSFARAYQWSGIKVGPLHHPKMAIVASTADWHQSALIGSSFASPFVPTMRLDSAAGLSSIVAELNQFKPDSLFAYGSILGSLTGEQVAGRLSIQPRWIFSCSEHFPDHVRQSIRVAWNLDPFNMYSATETGVMASECAQHNFHLFDDLVITEVVDEKNKPVPPGECGAKLLVTVLFSKTLPLIRYEMSDRVMTALKKCPCGLPFPTIRSVEGRTEDTLRFKGINGGTKNVDPNIFHRILELKTDREWQIVQHDDAIEIRLAGTHPPKIMAEIESETRSELRQLGANVEVVHARDNQIISRGPTGKIKLVIRN